MSNPFKIASDASKLSIPQLQQALQNGTVPPYIGIPLLQDMVQKTKQSQAMAGGQQKPPTVAEQVMAQAQQAQGVPSLQTNLPQSEYAAGGIVAFASGDLVDDDETDYEDYLDNARQQEMNDLMDEYAQTFQGGIGQLPAAQQMSEERQQDSSQGVESAPDFIARIMHKESRGQRYGKDGQLLRSEKGALGEMQVMPGTNRDPGYGVKAARDSSPDEMARVGRDYATAMLQRYGDPKLAAIAYNMGPGATDKWLASGADISKLPRETQGYVKGFADGGPVHFQNRGMVEDDYTTIEGLEPSDLYAEAIKRARAARAQKEQTPEPPVKPGLWPYNAPEAGKFTYANQTKSDRQLALEAQPERMPTGNAGITYAPNAGMGNVTPTRYVPKESGERESEMMRAIKTPFRTVGAGLESLYGGKTGMPSGADYTTSGDLSGAIMGERGPKVTAPVAQSIPNIPRGRPVMANDPRLSGVQPDLAQDATLLSGIDLQGPGSSPANMGAPVSSIAGQANAGQTETKVDPMQEFRDLFKRREENVAKQREQDRYMALLSAGLGMMGGTSPNALANIGAGAQQGIQSLMASNKDRTAEENALMAGRLGLAKIGASQAQAEKMMQLRQDLQKDLLAQRDAAAAAALDEKRLARIERGEGKTAKLVSDIEDKIRAGVTKDIAGNVVLQNKPDVESIKEQMVQDRLRAHKTYGKKYKEAYGEDPFEGFGSTSTGGGTRIKFDAQGNMIK